MMKVLPNSNPVVEMENISETNKLHERIKKVGIKNAKKHIFFCVGPTCNAANPGRAEADWEALKKACGALADTIAINRTKVGCLRICQNGPVALTYPSGRWYVNATGENLKRIVMDDLVRNVPVKDLQVAENNLRD